MKKKPSKSTGRLMRFLLPFCQPTGSASEAFSLGISRSSNPEKLQAQVRGLPQLASLSSLSSDKIIHVASSDVQGPQPSELGAEPPSLLVASRAYQLSSALVGILTRSRVLNEEPLTLAGEEILAQGKRSDPRSLLCQGDVPGPGCHFSISPNCRVKSPPPP